MVGSQLRQLDPVQITVGFDRDEPLVEPLAQVHVLGPILAGLLGDRLGKGHVSLEPHEPGAVHDALSFELLDLLGLIADDASQFLQVFMMLGLNIKPLALLERVRKVGLLLRGGFPTYLCPLHALATWVIELRCGDAGIMTAVVPIIVPAGSRAVSPRRRGTCGIRDMAMVGRVVVRLLPVRKDETSLVSHSYEQCPWWRWLLLLFCVFMSLKTGWSGSRPPGRGSLCGAGTQLMPLELSVTHNDQPRSRGGDRLAATSDPHAGWRGDYAGVTSAAVIDATPSSGPVPNHRD